MLLLLLLLIVIVFVCVFYDQAQLSFLFPFSVPFCIKLKSKPSPYSLYIFFLFQTELALYKAHSLNLFQKRKTWKQMCCETQNLNMRPSTSNLEHQPQGQSDKIIYIFWHVSIRRCPPLPLLDWISHENSNRVGWVLHKLDPTLG